MSAQQDIRRIAAWLNGSSGVGHFNLIVGGSRQDEPTYFLIVACLYPQPPLYRVYAMGNVSIDWPKIYRAISDCTLPTDAESRYQQLLTTTDACLSPEAGWSQAQTDATQFGLPIGLYAQCMTASGKDRAILWMMNTVSPTMLLERLKRAARS